MSKAADQEVVEWIETKLKEINELSGYNTTLLADNIITEDTRLRDTDEPLVFIDDAVESISQTVRRGYASEMSIELGLIVPAYKNDQPLAARKAMRLLFADIRSVFEPYAVDISATNDVPAFVSGVYLDGREILLLGEGARSLEGKFRIRVAIKQKFNA